VHPPPPPPSPTQKKKSNVLDNILTYVPRILNEKQEFYEQLLLKTKSVHDKFIKFGSVRHGYVGAHALHRAPPPQKIQLHRCMKHSLKGLWFSHPMSYARYELRLHVWVDGILRRVTRIQTVGGKKCVCVFWVVGILL